MLALVPVCMRLVCVRACCACIVSSLAALPLPPFPPPFFSRLQSFVCRAVQDQMTVLRYAIGKTLQLSLQCCDKFSIQVFSTGSSVITIYEYGVALHLHYSCTSRRDVTLFCCVGFRKPAMRARS